MTKEKDRFQFFPLERLYVEYSWQIWALGWISIVKGGFWIFAQNAYFSDPLPSILPYKYLILTVPFVIFGFGAWNFRPWAKTGLLITSLLDLLFFVAIPLFLNKSVITAREHQTFSLFIEYLSGPLGDIAILMLLSLSWRSFDKK